MKHPICALLAAWSAVGLLISGSAWAGLISEADTSIFIDKSTGNGYLVGNLGFAHNSSDTNQYIACYSFGRTGGCYAHDPAGNFAACSTSDPDMIATIRSMNSDSLLVAQFNANGLCTAVEVETVSYNSPKR
jgi:hypothetical protein